MNCSLEKMAPDVFGFLLREEGFVQGKLLNEGQNFQIEFDSQEFSLQLEKYRREISPCLYKPAKPESRVDLFVLLRFLNVDAEKKIESNFFSDVVDTNESFQLQMKWIAQFLKQYLPEIRRFFLSRNFDRQVQELKDNLVGTHPELFRQKKV